MKPNTHHVLPAFSRRASARFGPDIHESSPTSAMFAPTLLWPLCLAALLHFLLPASSLGAADVLVSKNLGAAAYSASSVYLGFGPDQAFDDSTNTFWSAGAVPTQWIEVDLGAVHSITRCVLRVGQSPAGFTTHQVGISTNSIGGGGLTVSHTFQGTTYDGQLLQRTFTTPLRARYFQVRTVTSPSWVGWREIEVYAATGVPPSLVLQPADQSVHQGRSATFGVSATGSGPLGYEWRRHGTNIPGATTGLLVVSNASAMDAGPYEVVVTNSFGAVTSQVAVLTVLPPPQFSLTLSTNLVSEAANPGSLLATVTRDADFASAVAVDLVSSDPTEIASLKVNIAPGAASVTVELPVVNDGEVDGAQGVQLQVSASLYSGAAASLQVMDDDTAEIRTLGGQLSGSLGAGEYRVKADVTVPAGQVLAIEPGTRLRFETNTGLNIVGTLAAPGEATNRIQFTSAAESPEPGQWRGLTITTTPDTGMPSVLRHVEVSFAERGMLVNGWGPSLFLVDSVIAHSRATGIECYSPATLIDEDVQLLRCSVRSNGLHGLAISGYAVFCSGNRAGVTVEACEILGNGGAGLCLSGRGDPNFGCLRPRAGGATANLRRSVIHHNSVGIQAGGFSGYRTYGYTYLNVENSLIVSNASHGLLLEGASEGRILNNVLQANTDSGIRLAVNTPDAVIIRNNIVTANGFGLSASSQILSPVLNHSHNLVYGNASGNWHNYPPEFGHATTTNLNGTPADAQFNISVDPQFAASGGFRLLPASLAVNAGTTNLAPLTDHDGQPRFSPTDIGAFEVQPRFQFGAPSVQAGGTLVWPVDVQAAHVFRVQSSTNLIHWSDVATLTNSGGRASFSTRAGSQALEFFRAQP